MQTSRAGSQHRVRLLAIAVLLTAAPVGAEEPVARHFQMRILPLLKNRCVRCHGPLKQESELNLASANALARGGQGGPVVVPRDLGVSRLWQVVEADEMPPDEPLTPDEKELLKQWIAKGADGLPSRVTEDAPADEHWAFRKLEPSELPAVLGSSVVRSALDAHLQSTLESVGLTLSPEASRTTLLRRASLDLTGLPPTPDAVDAFQRDTRPDAYERVVDRYLAAPQYGERWGKHWLDAAGYADSNGYFSADTDRPLAYRYRDYVIRALNADKPFDEFLREQLAGDELANERAGFRRGQPTTPEVIELLEATHFLRNGQDGTDIGVQEPEAFEIDRRAALEGVVQVTATSLLGLTVNCARCHDHKFDPITQREYYQFQAIFFPAFNPQDWVNPQDRVVYAYLPGEQQVWEAQERRMKQQLDDLRAEFRSDLATNREPSEVLFDESFDDGWQSRWSSIAPGDDAPGGSVVLGADGALPGNSHQAHVRDGRLQVIAGSGEAWLSTRTSFDWTPNAAGAWIQATFDLIDNQVHGPPAERIGYSIAALDFDDSSAADGGNILIDGHPSGVTSVYRDYPGRDQRTLGQIGAIGYSPGRNYGVRVTNTGSDRFRLEHMVDGFADGVSLELNGGDLAAGGLALFFCGGRSFVVDQVRVERSLTDAPKQRDLTELSKSVAERRKAYEHRRSEIQSQRTPEPGRAIAWVTDRSPTPPAVPVLTRGLYHLRGANVEAGALRVLTDVGEELQLPPFSESRRTTGRRTALADWLTRPDRRPAALVARVHTNRIWSQYFARGIAPTTDNLGLSGEPATHPGLLNDLAREFIRSGWSVKSVHRRIVTSAVYRQSSAPRPDGLAIDPDNRLWWRWPLRRLDAETIRDSMLAVAGQLDLTQFGPYVPTQQTAIGEVVVDDQTAGARRRSVYLQQRRSQTLSLLKVFDAPAISTICTARPSSTVPLQSLALLNSDFSVARGEAMARGIMSEGDGFPDAAVRRAWQLAIGRDPTDAEARIAVDFLAAQQRQYSGAEARQWALADFCQMLLASNAFLYLE